MSQSYLRDQRGVAMLLELILVAAVLVIVGVALYQSNQAGKQAASVNLPKVAPAVLSADAAIQAVQADSDNEATLSAATEASADDVTAADDDVTNLSGSFSNANF